MTVFLTRDRLSGLCFLPFALLIPAWNTDMLEMQEPNGDLEDKKPPAKTGGQKWNMDDVTEL